MYEEDGTQDKKRITVHPDLYWRCIFVQVAGNAAVE
jgi:hypothetical protein